MLTAKDNFLETIKKDGKPDRLVNQWEAIDLIAPDPFLAAQAPKVERGGMGKDNWGATCVWPEDQPNWAPYHTEETIILKDLPSWREQIEVPVLDFPSSDWDDARAQAAKTDRSEKLVTGFFPFGLFERMHRIMGFEYALTSMIEFPSEYMELCEVIGAERIREVKILIEELKPDMILFHDDWGMKTSLFMNPKKWRKFFKPHYAELFKVVKDAGVLVMHHADSFLEPIIDDMAEIGIDVWQGTLPQNDIPKLQEQLAGRMTLMGGIDASIIDRENSSEAEIRAEVRRACSEYGPGGHFIPAITYGGPNDFIYPHVSDIITDEISAYNKEVYGI